MFLNLTRKEFLVQALKRLSEFVIEKLRSEIADAGGNEVFAQGYLNDAGLVISVEVLARGNEGAVLAEGPTVKCGLKSQEQPRKWYSDAGVLAGHSGTGDQVPRFVQRPAGFPDPGQAYAGNGRS